MAAVPRLARERAGRGKGAWGPFRGWEAAFSVRFAGRSVAAAGGGRRLRQCGLTGAVTRGTCRVAPNQLGWRGRGGGGAQVLV